VGRGCCCRVLQCVASCCSVLQCVAVCCSVLQRHPSAQRWRRKHSSRKWVWDVVSECCSVLQCVAVCCSDVYLHNIGVGITVVKSGYGFLLYSVAVCCSVLQCVAVCCGVLRRVAVFGGMLRCVAVCCSVWRCCRDIHLHNIGVENMVVESRCEILLLLQCIVLLQCIIWGKKERKTGKQASAKHWRRKYKSCMMLQQGCPQKQHAISQKKKRHPSVQRWRRKRSSRKLVWGLVAAVLRWPCVPPSS